MKSQKKSGKVRIWPCLVRKKVRKSNYDCIFFIMSYFKNWILHRVLLCTVILVFQAFKLRSHIDVWQHEQFWKICMVSFVGVDIERELSFDYFLVNFTVLLQHFFQFLQRTTRTTPGRGYGVSVEVLQIALLHHLGLEGVVTVLRDHKCNVTIFQEKATVSFRPKVRVWRWVYTWLTGLRWFLSIFSHLAGSSRTGRNSCGSENSQSEQRLLVDGEAHGCCTQQNSPHTMPSTHCLTLAITFSSTQHSPFPM